MVAIAAVLDEHGKQLAEHKQRLDELVSPTELRGLIRRVDDMEEIPLQMRALSHEFEKLREHITAPLGRLEVHQRSLTMVLVGIADKQGVEVPGKLRASTAPRLDEDA